MFDLHLGWQDTEVYFICVGWLEHCARVQTTESYVKVGQDSII